MNLPVTFESLSSLPRFAPSVAPISEVHKTGLGSSASLVSSLVTSLLVHFGVPSKDLISPSGVLPNDALVLAHNTAQYAHCLAQGKIGSGFDVSAAIYGSHLYRRFDPSVIAPLMDARVGALSLQRRTCFDFILLFQSRIRISSQETFSRLRTHHGIMP